MMLFSLVALLMVHSFLFFYKFIAKPPHHVARRSRVPAGPDEQLGERRRRSQALGSGGSAGRRLGSGGIRL